MATWTAFLWTILALEKGWLFDLRILLVRDGLEGSEKISFIMFEEKLEPRSYEI